jgi:hypothetical protein
MYFSTDFSSWQAKLEEESSVNFVKTTGKKKVSGGLVQYLYCNRSGFFRSVSKGLRASKANGSCKIDGHCTAYIAVKECKDSSEINIEGCLTHYTHDISLGKLRLSKSKRIEIAAKLSEGIPVTRIVEDIRNTINSGYSRIHLNPTSF